MLNLHTVKNGYLFLVWTCLALSSNHWVHLQETLHCHSGDVTSAGTNRDTNATVYCYCAAGLETTCVLPGLHSNNCTVGSTCRHHFTWWRTESIQSKFFPSLRNHHQTFLFISSCVQTLGEPPNSPCNFPLSLRLLLYCSTEQPEQVAGRDKRSLAKEWDKKSQIFSNLTAVYTGCLWLKIKTLDSTWKAIQP